MNAVICALLWPRAVVDAWVGAGVQQQDWAIHVATFAVLGALSLWTYGELSAPCRSRWLAWIGCAALGAVLEWMQASMPGINRSCSWHDICMNALGAALGVLLTPTAIWSRGGSWKSRGGGQGGGRV